MLYIGLSWLLFWTLIEVFTLAADKAALVTGVVFVVLALILEGVPTFKRNV